MGLGVNEVFAASLDDMYRVFGNAPMPGRKVSRTYMGLGGYDAVVAIIIITILHDTIVGVRVVCDMCGNRTTHWERILCAVFPSIGYTCGPYAYLKPVCLGTCLSAPFTFFCL